MFSSPCTTLPTSVSTLTGAVHGPSASLLCLFIHAFLPLFLFLWGDLLHFFASLFVNDLWSHTLLVFFFPQCYLTVQPVKVNTTSNYRRRSPPGHQRKDSIHSTKEQMDQTPFPRKILPLWFQPTSVLKGQTSKSPCLRYRRQCFPFPFHPPRLKPTASSTVENHHHLHHHHLLRSTVT
ncbi:hypothetical protein B0T20DRAFT_167186 [Sordaria brevicollis]|uniref:Uncharacterized protein n=1 Tax=Sordaria brevicollis TaxID=83679 RepID=A0AAE0UD08_SORBR|nr:hypothetical protein B0T20DRAFT_167186 [Sordaria brevicollis]